MSEALQAAKKENAALKKRSDECDVAVVRYATQNAQLSTDLAAALQQRSRLEALCRALQARTGAAPAPAPAAAAEPEPPQEGQREEEEEAKKD